jgi:hypothetical protein
VCEVASQTGAVSAHCAFEVQVTQVPVGAWQSGVAPVHASEFAAEHWPHEPPGWQAGVMPPHSLSPAQARQVWNAGSQTGDASLQSASARHGTQTPAVA